jgi:flagellar biogenesis protein FliO
MTPAPEYWMALRALASLAATLGLLLTLAWVYRTYGARWGLPTNPSAKKPRLRVVESKRLNPHTTLYLVEADDAEYLLAATAAQTTVIHTQPRKKSAKVGA